MPSTALIHARTSGPSGRAIAEGLDIDVVGRPGDVRTYVANGEYDYLIRWGTTGSCFEPTVRTINHTDAIAHAVDKALTLQTLASNGIPVPMWTTDWRTLTFPFMGRMTMRGKGGKGIVLYLQPSDVINQSHEPERYVQYIPKAREFRVHVAFGNVIKVSEKKYDPTKGKKYNPLVWNLSNGFVFRVKVRNFDPEYGNIAVDAVHSLGLDFGAVDMIEGTNGLPYVLEVNTAPGVTSPTTLKAYVQALRLVIGQ